MQILKIDYSYLLSEEVYSSDTEILITSAFYNIIIIFIGIIIARYLNKSLLKKGKEQI